MNLAEILIEGGLLTTLGVIAGIFLNRYFDRKNRKDKVTLLESKVEDMERENCLLCYGISACLDGLEQLGANHSVPKAKAELEKYLNKKAHGVEE